MQNQEADDIVKTYVTLQVLSTLAASLIWGINTLFLLDAGLSITEAFAANAFFTAGMVLFEVPTGVIADTAGRRASYLLGSATLLLSTLLYLLMWSIEAPFYGWAISSVLLGLGFTFFSGAVEAWLVDALHSTKHKGTLESVFSKGQIASGVAMLIGTIMGGVVAQLSNVGVPYVIRSALLALTFAVAFIKMKDVGFKPKTSEKAFKEMRKVFSTSIQYGLKNPTVRSLMISSMFLSGVSLYGFYAMQPYLLELIESSDSYVIAGIAAAIVAGSQIIGGMSAQYTSKIINRRTNFLIGGLFVSFASLALIGIFQNFWAVLVLMTIWSVMFAARMPIRQTFLNSLIPSAQRATVLSTDNLIGSSGGVVLQPLLGKTADVWGYATSFVVGAFLQLLALPFLVHARMRNEPTDIVKH